MAYRYYKSCVGFSRRDTNREGGLHDMIAEAREITRATFLKHVDQDDLREAELSLGYETHPRIGLTMAGDFYVTYHKSKLFGKPVYYFRQSAIEYIFMKG